MADGPLQRKDLTVFTLRRLPLVSGLQLLGYRRISGDLGQLFWWERRYWVYFHKIAGYDVIKYERVNNVLTDIRTKYGLEVGISAGRCRMKAGHSPSCR